MAKYEIYIFIILILMILLRPGVLYDLNNTMSGKFVFVVVIVLVTRYKPYLGLVMFLLIICLNNIREGVESKKEDDSETEKKQCMNKKDIELLINSKEAKVDKLQQAIKTCLPYWIPDDTSSKASANIDSSKKSLTDSGSKLKKTAGGLFKGL